MRALCRASLARPFRMGVLEAFHFVNSFVADSLKDVNSG